MKTSVVWYQNSNPISLQPGDPQWALGGYFVQDRYHNRGVVSEMFCNAHIATFAYLQNKYGIK